MIVDKFKAKIQKNIFWVLVLIKDLWIWTTVTSRAFNFVNIKLETFFIKEFWWERNWDDVNWFSTFKKHSQFENCENLKF